MSTTLSYKEFLSLINLQLNTKPHGFLKDFCDLHKLNYQSVSNCIHNPDIYYTKTLIALSKALGFSSDMIKVIDYQFTISEPVLSKKTVAKLKSLSSPPV